MTDKEKIITNEIDVSKCEYVCNTAFGKIGCKQPLMKYIHCSENPNCHYKQLQRKTAECEKWRHQAELGSDTTERLAKQLELKEQECEKLKAENFTADELINIQQEKINRYEQTLFEIKMYCKTALCVSTSKNDINFIQMIIDIIDKAKETENE